MLSSVNALNLDSPSAKSFNNLARFCLAYYINIANINNVESGRLGSYIK